MRIQRRFGVSMFLVPLVLVVLLVPLVSLQGCLFGIIDLRLRTLKIDPVEVGFEMPNGELAARLVPYVEGSGGNRGGRAYGKWQTKYRGGDSFAAVLAWATHSMTALVQVRDGRVEMSVIESEGLNEKDGKIHKVAVLHMKALRRTIDRAVRLERTTASLSTGPQPLATRPTTPAPPPRSQRVQQSARRPRVPAPPPPTMATDDQARPSIEGLDFGGYYALVIGNNQYSNLPVLRTPVPDAAVVSSLLELDYGFDVEILANATRSQIVMALNRYRGMLSATDNLLVYYAGHGWFDEEAARGYWLPVDAHKNDPSNWLSNATITDLIRVIPAKHVMVVADSCYSGTLTRGISMRPQGDNYFNRMAHKRARTVLTSGGLEPVEDGTGKHSVFAGAIIDALRENKSVMDGLNLFNSIRHDVMLESEQTPEYGDMRQAGHDGGDFLFVRTP